MEWNLMTPAVHTARTAKECAKTDNAGRAEGYCNAPALMGVTKGPARVRVICDLE